MCNKIILGICLLIGIPCFIYFGYHNVISKAGQTSRIVLFKSLPKNVYNIKLSIRGGHLWVDYQYKDREVQGSGQYILLHQNDHSPPFYIEKQDLTAEQLYWYLQDNL